MRPCLTAAGEASSDATDLATEPAKQCHTASETIAARIVIHSLSTLGSRARRDREMELRSIEHPNGPAGAKQRPRISLRGLAQRTADGHDGGQVARALSRGVQTVGPNGGEMIAAVEPITRRVHGRRHGQKDDSPVQEQQILAYDLPGEAVMPEQDPRRRRPTRWAIEEGMRG